MSRRNLEDDIAKWSERMGYKIRDADRAVLEKLCRPEMRDVLRHVVDYVRPASEARMIRKHLLLNKFKTAGKTYKIKARREDGGISKDIVMENGADNGWENLNWKLTQKIRDLALEKRELNHLRCEKKGLREEMRAGLSKLCKLRQRTEHARRGATRLDLLNSDLDMFLELTSSQRGSHSEIEIVNFDEVAEKEVDKCLEEAQVFEQGKGLQGKWCRSRSQVLEPLRQRVQMTALAVPPHLLFRALIDRMIRTNKQLRTFNKTLPPNSNEGLNNVLFIESQKLHLAGWSTAQEERSKLEKTKEMLQKATEETIAAIWEKLMADESMLEEFEIDPDNLLNCVRKWVENEVKGTVMVERTKRYNQLVEDLEAKIVQVTSDKKTASPGTHHSVTFRRDDQLDNLIEERLAQVGKCLSYNHTEYSMAVERSRAASSGFSTNMASSVSHLVDSLRNSLSLHLDSTTGCKSPQNSVTKGTSSSLSFIKKGKGDGDDESLLEYVMRRMEENSNWEDNTEGDIYGISWLTETSDHCVIATVLEKIRLNFKRNTTLPIYNMNTAHKLPNLEELITLQTKNKEKSEEKMRTVETSFSFLESKHDNCKKITKLWMEQPFNEAFVNSDIDELNDFKSLRKRLARAVDNIMVAHPITDVHK